MSSISRKQQQAINKNDEKINFVKIYQEGLTCYYNRKWDKAIDKFKISLKYETKYYSKHINPSKVFIEFSMADSDSSAWAEYPLKIKVIPIKAAYKMGFIFIWLNSMYFLIKMDSTFKGFRGKRGHTYIYHGAPC